MEIPGQGGSRPVVHLSGFNPSVILFLFTLSFLTAPLVALRVAGRRKSQIMMLSKKKKKKQITPRKKKHTAPPHYLDEIFIRSADSRRMINDKKKALIFSLL